MPMVTQVKPSVAPHPRNAADIHAEKAGNQIERHENHVMTDRI